MKTIAIEFDGQVVDAGAPARAVAFVFEASRVGEGATYIEGFSISPSDKWHAGDPKITIVER